MILPISINPPTHAYQEVKLTAKGTPIDNFPLLSIDRDSYIVQAEIHSMLDFNMEGRWHHIAIGKGCALADGIKIRIDENHDYKSIAQNSYDFLKDVACERRLPRKSAVIVQNDVWIGSCATIMAGTTLRNGCIVAANAVVTKDVPPYAIVGGNPARIIGYRFEEKIVDALQKIAYWDWTEDIQRNRKQDFALPVEAFIEKYLPLAECGSGSLNDPEKQHRSRKIVLFPADVADPFPVYPSVLEAYFAIERPNLELLIYVPKEYSTAKNINALEDILKNMRIATATLQFRPGLHWMKTSYSRERITMLRHEVEIPYIEPVWQIAMV